MLKKQNRLKKRKEFNFIYRKGTIAHAPDLFVHYVRATRPYAQIGVAVSKQVGNSVVRSRVKRIISEACRLNLDKFAIKNYVITAKPSAKDKKMQDIETELMFLLKKNHLLREETPSNLNAQRGVIHKVFKPGENKTVNNFNQTTQKQNQTSLSQSIQNKIENNKTAQTKNVQNTIAKNLTLQNKNVEHNKGEQTGVNTSKQHTANDSKRGGNV